MRSSILLILTLTLLQLIDSSVLQSTERTTSPFSPSSLQPSDPAPAINSTYSLAQELSSWTDLSILLQLVSLFPDLVAAAESADPLLLFAPTNDAFISVARALNPGISDDEADVIEALAAALGVLAELPDGVGVIDVLLYHLVSGDLPESDIRAAGTVDSLQGTRLSTRNYPRRIGDIDPILDSMRLGRQIATVNGRISIIDNVLLPLDLNETLSGTGLTLPSGDQTDGHAPTGELSEVFSPLRSLPSFITSRTDLVILATIAAQSDDLVRVLTDAEALHVFAPNNNAFVALVEALIPHFREIAMELLEEAKEALQGGRKELALFASRLKEGINSLEGLPTLEQIVAYHVINTGKSFSELVGAGEQETLLGGDARLVITENAVRDNDTDRGDAILIASFATGNGFVSIIDGVLLPISIQVAVDIISDALDGDEPGETVPPEPQGVPELPEVVDAFAPSSLQPNTPAPAIVSTYSLVEELSAWSDLSVLLRLVTGFPELVDAAQSNDELLVLAPTNDAFRTVARVLLPDTPEDADTDGIVSALVRIFETLAEAAPDLPGVGDILRYHIALGDFPERNIAADGSLQTLFGEALGTSEYPRKIEDVDPTVDSKRLGRQTMNTNGRISFVDNVLIPFNVANALSEAGISLPLTERMGDGVEMDDVFKPFQSLVDFVTSRTDLTVLATLVAGSETLLDVLSTATGLHVFAPTDRSFLALAEALVPEGSNVGLLPEEGEQALGNVTEIAAFAGRLATTWALLEGVPSLEEIVAYHVLNTSRSYEDLVGDGRQMTLLDGARIEILANGVNDDDPDREDAPRIASFATGNGFVAVIDGVLLPFPASTAIELVAAVLNVSDDPELGPTEEPEVLPSPDDDDAVCFPAHATVRLEDGSQKRMDKLSGGDSIAVSRDTHSAVYLFTHRLHKRVANFVTLETNCNRSVTLTRSHYVYADGRLASAGEVRLGEALETDSGFCQVVKMSKVVGRGLFAPHTMHGDLVVDGVKVSSYSTAVEPRLAHWSLALVRVLVRFGVAEPLQGWFDEGAPRLAAVLPGGYQRY